MRKENVYRLLLSLVLSIAFKGALSQINPGQMPSAFSTNPNGVTSDTTSADSTFSNHSDKPAIIPFMQKANLLWHGLDTLIQEDSQLLLNHRYSPENRSVQPLLNLGLYGGPLIKLSSKKNVFGLSSGILLNDIASINPYNFLFRKVEQAFTQFDYSQGAGGYVGLEALHSQNFSPTWNVSIDYRSVLNEDMYVGANQDNLGRNLGIGSRFITENERYEQQLILSWNRNRRVENGGLQTDSLFYGPLDSDITAFQQRTFGFYYPNLSEASSFTSKTHHQLKHRYFLDTQKSWSAYHIWNFHNDRRTYSDEAMNRNFYTLPILFDTTETRDSISFKYGSQEFGIENNTNKFHLGLGLDFQYGGFRYQNDTQIQRDLTFRSTGVNANLILFNTIAGWTQIHYSRYFGGYLDKNEKITFTSKNKLSDSFDLQIGLNHQKNSPTIFQNYFLSNFYDFKGNLSEGHTIICNQLNASIQYKNGRLKLSSLLSVGNRNGEIGLIQQATPSIIGNFRFVEGNVNARLKGQHWMFVSSLAFHKNNASEVTNLGIPILYPRLGLSYQNDAFRKALSYRLGIDLSYTSSYANWEYRPEMGQFILHNDRALLGNYPLFDVYLSGRIQTVDFFLKFEHLNEWWLIPRMNYRYESSLTYPIQPFRFRFGFSWKFWN
ncbi:MAG: putative porin [Bacteroidota bacterium]|nr:putative porin [Bacteroidota bacterium]